jgi:lipopolysaccharide transport system permease protein
MLPWGYFANTFTGTSATFLVNAGLFGKVYFPRLLVPLAACISHLVGVAIQGILFYAMWSYYRYSGSSALSMPISVLLSPLVILHIAVLGLGFGLWMSALTAKYRDFIQVSAFIVNIWIYATPVIYPLSLIPERWKLAVLLNPVTMPVEAFKAITLGHGSVTFAGYMASLGITAVVLLSGLTIFQKVERTFVDVV